MYSNLRLAKKYFHYYITASNRKGHGTHSPFVFDLIKNVFIDRHQYDDYQVVESIRNKLARNHTLVQVDDMGAGSVASTGKQRKVSEIVRHAAKPKKFGQLLFRIVQYFQPNIIIELGTSLGLTTSYLALGNKNAGVTSLEGAPDIATIAKENFEQAGLKNIDLIEGNFDETLPGILNNISTVDFVFVDGNHRYEPTLRYFNELLLKINASSILIFDDIHWSKEMEDAWEKIRTHQSVKLSIDLFFVGLVFFRDEFKTKQHFTIRF